MTDQEIIDIVNKTIAEEFELELNDMTPESHLVDDLELDSLDFVDMVVVLQNAFSIKLRDDNSFREVRKLGDLHELVIKKKQELESAN